jgi:hypothetical protein
MLSPSYCKRTAPANVSGGKRSAPVPDAPEDRTTFRHLRLRLFAQKASLKMLAKVYFVPSPKATHVDFLAL